MVTTTGTATTISKRHYILVKYIRIDDDSGHLNSRTNETTTTTTATPATTITKTISRVSWTISMHEPSQIVSKISVQEAVENGVGDGGDQVGVVDDDVVGDDAVGHEQSRGERRDEDHADYEQDQRHSDVGLRADQILNFLLNHPNYLISLSFLL